MKKHMLIKLNLDILLILIYFSIFIFYPEYTFDNENADTHILNTKQRSILPYFLL